MDNVLETVNSVMEELLPGLSKLVDPEMVADLVRLGFARMERQHKPSARALTLAIVGATASSLAQLETERPLPAMKEH